MKKLLTAALTTVVGTAFAASAMATETRVNSLSAAGGLGGAFNEKTITLRDTDHSRLDSNAIDVFPQWMVWHKNSVDVDNTVGTSYGSMNVRYALSDDPAPPVLMLFGKRSPWAPVTNVGGILPGGKGNTPTKLAGGPGFGANPISGQTLADATNHQFGIGFGMKAGESVRLGATLSIGGNRADTQGQNPTSAAQTDDEQSNTWVNFNFGLGFDINEVNSLDFGLNIMGGSFTNMNGNSPFYASNGLFGFAFTARGEFMVSQISRIVPYLRVNYDSRSVIGQVWNNDSARTNLIGTVNNTWIILGSDLAIMPPNMEGVLIQPGIGLIAHLATAAGNSDEGASSSTREDASNIMPWYGFSAEAKAFEWLFLRLGARQVISRVHSSNTATAQGQNNETFYSSVTNTVSTGLGIKLMGWDLDINMNPAFFNNGIMAVSGNPTPGWGVDWALGYDW